MEPTATDSDCWRLVHSFTRSGESARALLLSRTANALVLQHPQDVARIELMVRELAVQNQSFDTD